MSGTRLGYNAQRPRHRCERARVPARDLWALRGFGKSACVFVVETLADDEELINEMYLTFFARRPDVEETSNTMRYLKNNSDDRQAAAEDLAWSLMNTLEFVFNH